MIAPFPLTVHQFAEQYRSPVPAAVFGSVPVELVQPTQAISIRQDLLRVSWIKDWTNVLVAGGHVTNAVVGDDVASFRGDIDVFLHGEVDRPLDAQRVVEVVQKLVSWARNIVLDSPALQASYRSSPLVMQTGSSLRVMFPPLNVPSDSDPYGVLSDSYTVQIVTMVYFPSVNDVLLASDLANCQFGYKGGLLYATPAAMLYLQDHTIGYYDLSLDTRLSSVARSHRAARIRKYGARTYNRMVALPGPPAGVDLRADLLNDYVSEPLLPKYEGKPQRCFWRWTYLHVLLGALPASCLPSLDQIVDRHIRPDANRAIAKGREGSTLRP